MACQQIGLREMQQFVGQKKVLELVAEPPDLTCDTRIVGLDPGEMPEKQGLAGFCALTGEMIKAAGVPEGPEIGRVRREVEEWWVDSDFIDDEFSIIERLKAVVQATVY